MGDQMTMGARILVAFVIAVTVAASDGNRVVPESTNSPGDILIDLKQEEPTDLLQVKQEMAKLHLKVAQMAKLQDKLEQEVSRLSSQRHASELLSTQQNIHQCPDNKVPVCDNPDTATADCHSLTQKDCDNRSDCTWGKVHKGGKGFGSVKTECSKMQE